MKKNKAIFLYLILAAIILIQIFVVPAAVTKALDLQKNQIIRIAE